MQTLVFNCGYCSARSQTGEVIALDPLPQEPGRLQEHAIGIRCRRCKMISCLRAFLKGQGQLVSPHHVDITDAIHVLYTHPPFDDPTAPDHVPPIVARAFVQAEKQVGDAGMTESAAVMYRRTVEQALAIVAQSRGIPLQGRNLKDRIDAAATAQLIPHDLAQWAHDVRELGNEGAHGNGVSQTELKELRGFVDLFLRYLFWLPGLMNERRAPKSQDAA